MKKLILFSALASVAFTPMAAAKGFGDGQGPRGDRPSPMEKMLKHHDTNEDGVISKEEFMKSAEERFIKIDLDGNGEVTKEEAQKHHQSMMEKRKGRKGARPPPPPPGEESVK